MVDRARNTLTQALRISLGSTQKLIRESVGLTDRDDLYRFRLSSSSQVDLKLSGIKPGANLNIELLSLKGNRTTVLRKIGNLSFSTIPLRVVNSNILRQDRPARPGNTAETISKTLAAGEYYIRVYRVRGDSNYRLNYAATPSPSPTPTPGPTPSPSPTPTPTPNSSTPWLKQFGSAGNDYAYGTTTDSAGNVYVSGTTPSAAGSSVTDIFVAKYDSSGAQLWFRPFNASSSTSGSDIAFDVAIDSAGNYYVAGANNITSTSADGFVAKFNASGDRLWQEAITSNATISIGSVPAGDGVSSLALSEDGSGNVSLYITGFKEAVPPNIFGDSPSNAFVAKYTTNLGTTAATTSVNQNWETAYGGSGSDGGAGVAIDSTGNVYITGVRDATLKTDLNDPFEKGDAFVAKFNSSGLKQWEATLGTAGNANIQDYARSLAVDGSGNVYITGQTDGALPGQTNSGGRDGFIAKYVQNLSGTSASLSWVRQVGTSTLDEAQSITVDSTGNIYITGETTASIFSNTYAGGSDAWIAKYDSTGTLLTTRQLGTTADDESYSITVDSVGNIYVAGQTQGVLEAGGINQGSYDAWIVKYLPF